MLNARELGVVHRDAHFLAVEKPSGIATTAPDGGPSLFALAQALDPSAPQLHPLSRLDTQVTGLVVFARTKAANEVVLAARRAGRMVRRYLGLCAQPALADQGEWRWSIALNARDPKLRRALDPSAAAGPGTKYAHTVYRVRARGALLCALDLFPHTGRTHQLRVHAQAAGAPLLGDVAYGGAKRLTLPNGRILTAARVMLHCAALRLPHPDPSVGELALSSPAPADMVQLWSAAGGDAADLG